MAEPPGPKTMMNRSWRAHWRLRFIPWQGRHGSSLARGPSVARGLIDRRRRLIDWRRVANDHARLGFPPVTEPGVLGSTGLRSRDGSD
jgi:hypothetical protein